MTMAVTFASSVEAVALMIAAAIFAEGLGSYAERTQKEEGLLGRRSVYPGMAFA